MERGVVALEDVGQFEQGYQVSLVVVEVGCMAWWLLMAARLSAVWGGQWVF